MNKSIKRTMGLVLALFVAVSMCVDISGVFAEGEKTPLLINVDISKAPGKGHSTPGAPGQMGEAFDEMWKNLPITVTDSSGENYSVTNEFYDTKGEVSERSMYRLGGLYKEGEELTITIDTSSLPDGHHISYSPFDKEDEPYIIEGGYNKFKIKYTYNSINPNIMEIKIPIGSMSVKFDLQGGNISGNKDAITKTVKKDNTVDFPDNPTKENLNFGGWYTKRPETYNGKPLKSAGKMYFWSKEKKFSDYNRDWVLFNDPKEDPLFDGIFLLKALWKAEVKFNSNGGSPVDDAMVNEGEKVSEPEAPVKKYAEFLGWTTADGEDYDFSQSVTGNMVLTAKWNDYTMPKGKDIKINVGDKFKPEDGISNKDKLPKGTIIETKDNVDTNVPGVYNVTLQVKYPNGDVKEVSVKVTVKQDTNDEKYYNITFDANGGKWIDNKTKKIVQAKKNDNISIMEAPTKEGYKFLYWKGSKYQPGQKYKVIEDHTFTAVWEPNKPAKVRKIPQTGDSSEIMLYAGLTALMGLSTLLIMRKRKVNN